MLVALLFVLLRPVCEALAAPVDWHAPSGADHGYVQVADLGAGETSHGAVCCTAVDAQALAVPATPLLVTAAGHALTALPPEPRHALHWGAPAEKFVARRDAAPPLRYHARSLRRLD